MEEGLRMLYTGNYNYCSKHREADGSVTVILSKSGEPFQYKFRVRDLEGKDEKVLSHEVINHRAQKDDKPWIAERMATAKAEKEKEDKEKKEKPSGRYSEHRCELGQP